MGSGNVSSLDGQEWDSSSTAKQRIPGSSEKDIANFDPKFLEIWINKIINKIIQSLVEKKWLGKSCTTVAGSEILHQEDFMWWKPAVNHGDILPCSTGGDVIAVSPEGLVSEPQSSIWKPLHLGLGGLVQGRVRERTTGRVMTPWIFGAPGGLKPRWFLDSDWIPENERDWDS